MESIQATDWTGGVKFLSCIAGSRALNWQKVAGSAGQPITGEPSEGGGADLAEAQGNLKTKHGFTYIM